MLILLTGVMVSLTTIYATLIVRLNSPGKPPTAFALIGLVLLFLGYFFNRKSLKSIV
jgi:xanthosine utilization system XapX-like protein